MATFDPDEPTRFGAWCDALGYPCASYGGLKVSQPSSSFICVPLVVGYVYFGIKILVENARKGTHWAWCDDHLADYVGTAHCRAERLPDHSTRERCNFLYGVALLLMAACMVFAGANYQAFTWQLHCEGADAACIKNPARDLEPAELPRYDADHSWCGILYNWLQVLSVYVWVLGDFYRASRAHVRHALAMGVAMPLLFALFIACIPVHGQAALFYAGTLFMVPAFVAVAWLSLRVRYEPRMAALVADQIIANAVMFILVAYANEEREYRRSGFWLYAYDVQHILLYPFCALLWWASLRAEDAPPGSRLTTEDQHDRRKIAPDAEAPA